MGKGSAPAGTTTTQQVNPVQQLQQPYLQDIFSNAKDLYRDNPPSPYLTQGYQQIYGAGQAIGDQLRQPANNVYYNAAGGNYGVQNSPAYGGLNSFATGTSAPQQTYDTIQNAALAAGPAYAANIAQYAPGLAGYAGQAAGPNTGTTALAGQSSYNNPAVSQLLAQNPGTQALAGAAAGQGFGLNALKQTASGAYLNSNPYLDAMYRSASDPVARAYQTVTAPTTDAAFSGGGRYGSGAAAGARDTNELNLGKTLGDLSTNIYGQNYARERAAQDKAAGDYQTLINQAGSQYGQLSNQAASNAGQLINTAALNYGTLANQGLDTALRGLTAAGGLQTAAGAEDRAGRGQALTAAQQQAAAQQYGISGLGAGYNAGNEAALRAMAGFPALATGNLIGPQATVQAGQGLTATPWAALDQYRQAIGAGYGGSANTTSPYFQNGLASTLGGISGGLGIANQLGGSGGLLSGLGGAGTTGAVLSGIGSGALPAVIAPDIGAAGLGALGALNPGIPAIAAAAAPLGATIICTELVRQDRMPDRWRRAGMRQFMRYPAIARRGYWVWAVPVVRHLRKSPDSFFSRAIVTAFNWRAEDLAARAGVEGARKLLRGRMVTAAMVLPCLLCGAVGKRDWRVVYREEKA